MTSAAPPSTSRRFPAETWRQQAWLAFLVAAITAVTFVYACAAPFAAFSVLAAMTLSRADAFRITIALWLANQFVGYALLSYPVTANSVSWGLAMGVAAVLGTMAARWIVARLEASASLVQAAAALGGAFAVYEVALYVVAVAWLGGIAVFAAPITGRILAVNLATLAALYVLYRLGVALGVGGQPAVAGGARAAA